MPTYPIAKGAAGGKFYTFRNQVPGGNPGFTQGRGYYARPGSAGAGRRPGGLGYDPFAPLSPQQIQQEAQRAVSAQTSPLLKQLQELFASRSQQGSSAITGYTNALAHALSGYADSASRIYGGAEKDQAAINAAVSSELHGGGGQVAASLSDRLGAAGIDPAFVKQLADNANQTGAGSAGAAYASGSAELSKLLALGAGAADYGAKLPGLAALGGLQHIRDFQGELNTDLQTQSGNITAGVPAAVSSLMQSLQGRELQKAIARQSGLLQDKRATATVTAAQDRAAATKAAAKTRADATRAAAKTRADAQKQARTDKQTAKAAADTAKTTKTRSAYFYKLRQQTFQAAAKLYQGTKKKTAAGAQPPKGSGLKGAPATGAASASLSVNEAYSRLWNQYGVDLEGHGFKKAAIDVMIRRALRAAGWKA